MLVSPRGGGAELRPKRLSHSHYGKLYVSGQSYKEPKGQHYNAPLCETPGNNKANVSLVENIEFFSGAKIGKRHVGVDFGFCKAAFTLAEVLITLGIIGVVAAMTLPTLINNYKKQVTITHLQKFYTTINQALIRSEADHGDYKYWETDSNIEADAYFDKYWKPYFSGITICHHYLECNYKSHQPFYNINGTKDETVLISENARTTFKLPDGTVVIMFTMVGPDADNISSSSLIYVDVNGGKEPNTYGKDLFVFVRDKKGVIIPKGINNDSINCNQQQGNECAAKIVKDGWQIKDDYPW